MIALFLALTLRVTPYSQAVGKACEQIAWVTSGDVTCDRFGERPIDISVDSEHPNFRLADIDAFAKVRPDSCSIVMISSEIAKDAPVIAHELGHCIGMTHSRRPADLMHPILIARKFSKAERQRWRTVFFVSGTNAAR